MNYEHLLSPITLRGKTFRNRALAAPTGYFSFLDTLGDNYLNMIEERARGGFASVCTGEMTVNNQEAARGDIDLVDIPDVNGKFFPLAQRAAETVKKHGAIAMMELSHLGSIGNAHPGNEKPWGPISFTCDDGVEIIGYTREMMKKTIRDFADCAVYAKAAGFDGVTIHGGHGWLFSQFLSPLENTREDEYGGSLSNRAKFPLEILRAVRAAVGEDFLIELRISGSDRWPGGTSAEDMAEFSTWLSGLVDILHVSSGHYYRSYRTLEFSSHFSRHNCNLDTATIIRQKCPNDVKMGLIGGINSPEDCEKMLADGVIDFVIFGRQAFADPNFMNKVAAGQADDINRCLRCMRCYSGSHEHKVELEYLKKYGITKEMELAADAKRAAAHGEYLAYCSINPESRGMGHMKRPAFPEVKQSRKVLIVGGGVAGLTAAAYAADRGHQVTLVEKSDRLGGVLWFLDYDPEKQDLRYFRDMLIRRVKQRPIEIQLNTEADAALIHSSDADVVMFAVGASANQPPIPGIEHAVMALDSYRDHKQLGQRVILLGGGMVGCETAIMLAEAGHEVTIVEMAERLAMEARNMAFTCVMDKIDEQGIQSVVNARCTEIQPGGIHYVTPDGASHTLSADSVVCCLGMHSNRNTVETLKAAVPDSAICVELGDCHVVDRVGDAVLDGYLAAMRIQ